MKKLIRRLARSAGYDIVPYPLPDAMFLAHHLSELFALLDINLLIDVGAHRGEFGSFARGLGYDGRIVSFEPVPETFEKLERRSRNDPRWTAYPLALGAEEATRPINVTQSTDFSSFLSPSRYSAEWFGTKGSVRRTEVVPVRRLENLWGEIAPDPFEPRVYLKLDTQGFDLQVLAGAAGCLGDVLALQSEVSAKNIYEGMTDYLDAIGRMREIGFDVTGLFPVTRQDRDLAVIEFDCVMIRRADQSQIVRAVARAREAQRRARMGLAHRLKKPGSPTSRPRR